MLGLAFYGNLCKGANIGTSSPHRMRVVSLRSGMINFVNFFFLLFVLTLHVRVLIAPLRVCATVIIHPYQRESRYRCLVKILSALLIPAHLTLISVLAVRVGCLV